MRWIIWWTELRLGEAITFDGEEKIWLRVISKGGVVIRFGDQKFELALNELKRINNDFKVILLSLRKGKAQIGIYGPQKIIFGRSKGSTPYEQE